MRVFVKNAGSEGTELEKGDPLPGVTAEPLVFVTGGFLLFRRNVNRREHARPIQDGERAGIAAIRLDAIAGAARDQGWSNDVARNLAAGKKAL